MSNQQTSSAMTTNTNQPFAMLTRTIDTGFFEIEFCPAGSDVFTSFYLIHNNRTPGRAPFWQLMSIGGNFHELFATKRDAIDFIKTRITRGGRFEHLFQN